MLAVMTIFYPYFSFQIWLAVSMNNVKFGMWEACVVLAFDFVMACVYAAILA